MRQNNITKWKYDSSLNCLLFFAQRLDELLFHHTTDTYRYPSLSLRGLAAEYCSVYSDVRAGTVNKKNLEHIIEELSGRLDHDDIAKNILTEEFSSRFIKSHKSWDIKTQFENVQYIGRKLSNKTYYNHIVESLKHLEHTFAFLAFKFTQPDRDCLFASTETYPLLRYRVCTLSDSLQNSKEIKSLIKAHTQRVTWHLHRIYRARNYIIHDANSNNRLNQGLVINLHSYVDTLFSEVITHISISPYNDSIYDAITNHKLSVLIMDEKLENRKNEEITVDNALQYLYYDFER